MKTTNLVSAIIALSGAMAMAQSPKSGPSGPPNRAEMEKQMIEHLTQVYTAVKVYDADQNGRIADSELEALVAALSDGSLTLPKPPMPPHPPKGDQGGKGDKGKAPAKGGESGEKHGEPSPEMIANHASHLYEMIAGIDADHNGQLDEKEVAALKKEMQKHKPHGPRPPKDGDKKGPPPGEDGPPPPPPGDDDGAPPPPPEGDDGAPPPPPAGDDGAPPME